MAKTVFSLLASLLLAALPAFAAPSPATRPAAQPTTKPTTAPSTQPSAAEEQAKLIKLRSLTLKSMDLCKAKKYAEAEDVIAEALAIDPNEPTNIYNMACMKALRGHPTEAMDYLERSADAGFADFIHISKDTDLDTCAICRATRQ